MRKSLAVLAIFGTALSGALAQNAPQTIIANTNLDSIVPVLQLAGLTPQSGTIGGEAVAIVRSGSNVMVLRPTVCNPNCKGLQMFAQQQGTSPGGVINKYNAETPATTAYNLAGTTVLERYLIADHGMTEGSFLVNVNVFDNTINKWRRDSTQASKLSVSLNQPEANAESAYSAENKAFLEAFGRRGDLYSKPGQQAF